MTRPPRTGRSSLASKAWSITFTPTARSKNSSPENLTQLHDNLLGKDSKVAAE